MTKEKDGTSLTSTQVSYICEAFFKQTTQHQSLEAHYFSLVDEADRLHSLNSELQTSLTSLRATVADRDLKSYKDLAKPLVKQGAVNTYNQICSVMDEIHSSHSLKETAYVQERTEIVFFLFIKEATSRVFQMMKMIERQVGSLSNIDLSEMAAVIADTTLDRLSSAKDHSPLHHLAKDKSLHLSEESVKLLTYHLRNEPILRLFLEESELKSFCSRYGNNDSTFRLHFGELLIVTNRQFKATIEKLTKSCVKVLQDTSAEERRVAKEFGDRGRSVDRRRSEVIITGLCDSSLPLDSTGAQFSPSVERGSAITPSKSIQSDSIQTELKRKSGIVSKTFSPITSPRRVHLKRPFFLFPETSIASSDEEDELSLLRLERKTIKMQNRLRTGVSGSTRSEEKRRKMSRPGLVPMRKSQDMKRFEEIKQLRSRISIVQRQGKRHLERESEGKKSARQVTKSVSQPRLRNGQLADQPPDWDKNAYFPMLRHSVKRQVKRILNITSLTSRHGV